MNFISINFKKKELNIKRDGQKGVEIVPDLNKENFTSFFTKEMLQKDYDSYSWDFENEMVSCNKENYEPLISYPFIGLKDRFGEFLQALDYEEVKGGDLLTEINKTILEGAIKQAFEDLFKEGDDEDE